MGYLNNSSVTVDAILTLKGRELLAKGGNAFQITQFAVGDDEIDYSLYNANHPLGTNFYGTIIENLPITEAIPDETQALKYKLVTLPKQITRIPVITVANPSITLQAAGDTAVITPNTSNFASGNSTFGYTAILADSTIADISVVQPLANPGTLPTTPTAIGNNADAQSIAVAGFAFQITAKNLLEDKTTTVNIIANETGGSTTVNVTVKKQTVASSAPTL